MTETSVVSDLLTAVGCVLVAGLCVAVASEVSGGLALLSLLGVLVFGTLGAIFSIAAGVRLGSATR